MATIRQRIIEMLEIAEYDVREISQQIGIREKEVCDHLPHIARSVAARKRKMSMTPAICIDCGFTYNDRKKFTRPSRCPKCKGQRISQARYGIIP